MEVEQHYMVRGRRSLCPNTWRHEVNVAVNDVLIDHSCLIQRRCRRSHRVLRGGDERGQTYMVVPCWQWHSAEVQLEFHYLRCANVEIARQRVKWRRWIYEFPGTSGEPRCVGIKSINMRCVVCWQCW